MPVEFRTPTHRQTGASQVSTQEDTRGDRDNERETYKDRQRDRGSKQERQKETRKPGLGLHVNYNLNIVDQS